MRGDHRTKPWLQGLAAPDVTSVPGDALVGFLLAGKGGGDLADLGAVLLAVLCFRGGGRIVRVLAQRDGRRGEPGEPPWASVPALGLAAALLFAAGGGLCYLVGEHTYWISLSLVLATLLYRLGLEDVRCAGAVNAGFCRGLVVLLGAAAAVGPAWYLPEVMLGFDVTVLYAAAVSHLVREECLGHKLGAGRWAPAFVACAAFAACSRMQMETIAPAWIVFTGAFALAAFLALAIGDMLDVAAAEGEGRRSGLFHEPRPGRVPLLLRLVNLLYSSQLLVQAGLAASSGAGEAAVLAGLVLVSLWPLSRVLNRWS